MSLTKPNSGDPGYSGATKASTVIGAIVDSINQGPINVKDAVYGAVGDGSADDTTPLQNAIAALPANNGTLFLPYGSYKYGTALDFHGKSNVRIVGLGGLTAGATGASKLLYTGTGSQAINAQSSVGFGMSYVQVVYNNSGFTGPLLDLTGASGSDTSGALIEHCSFFSSSIGTIQTAVGIALNKCNSSSIIGCSFGGLDKGTTGMAASGYANGITVQGCHFSAATGNIVTACMSEAGQGWVISGNTFEPLVSGAPGAFTNAQGCDSVNFIGNWFGDATTGGNWINLGSAAGIDVVGNYFGLRTSAVAVKVTANSTFGLTVTGNYFDGSAGTALDWGTTTSNAGWLFAGNGEHSGVTSLNGTTVPPNSIIQSVDLSRIYVGSNINPDAADTRDLGTLNRMRVVSAQSLRTEHVGAATPTGGSSGDIKVGNSKIWVNDAGTWKSAAIA